MRRFVIDCSAVTCEMDLWDKYVAITQPEGVDFFGYNLSAFDDAITGGGPGWPGECEIYFINTWRVQKFRDGTFFKNLQRIADASTNARIYLETSAVPKKQWWKIW